MTNLFQNTGFYCIYINLHPLGKGEGKKGPKLNTYILNLAFLKLPDNLIKFTFALSFGMSNLRREGKSLLACQPCSSSNKQVLCPALLPQPNTLHTKSGICCKTRRCDKRNLCAVISKAGHVSGNPGVYYSYSATLVKNARKIFTDRRAQNSILGFHQRQKKSLSNKQ